MVDLKGKNKWVMPVIEDAGYIVSGIDEVLTARLATRALEDVTPETTIIDEAAVQAIVDGYDALPEAKAEKIQELKLEGTGRMNLIYDDEDKIFPYVASVELLIDIDTTYVRSNGPAPRLVSVNLILNAFKAARTDVNALTTLAEVVAYNVITDPAWP